jgi:hypothetical protein
MKSNNKIRGIVLVELIIICLSLFSFSNLAQAEQAFDCSTLNTPEKIDKIFTIIEEPFGGIGGNLNYFTCFRRTCCKTASGSCGTSEFPDVTVEASAKRNKAADYRKCYSDYQPNCTPTTDDKAATVTSCKKIGIFYATSGTELLYTYISSIYRYTASVIGIICVFFITYGGVRIAAAGDNPGIMDAEKKRIIQSLSGLVLLFLSAAILYSINPNFFTLS